MHASPSLEPNSVPRVALIGVTGYGVIYVRLLREALARSAVRLVATVIINPDVAQEVVAEYRELGVNIYGSAEEMFEKESGRVDLCLIPTGIQWHARLTIGALRAGMNVLVEKPLAGSLEDAASMRRAEKETGRWIAVGYQDIYAAETRWLKEQLLAGAIGRIEEIRMIGLWPRPRSYFARNHWAGRVRADGAAVLDSPLNNAFAHFINLSLFLAGPSFAESARVELHSVELFRAHAIEMFDTAVVQGSAPRGPRFWFGVSHATDQTRQPEISIRGSHGRVEWRYEQTGKLVDASGREHEFRAPTIEETRRAMLEASLARLKDHSVFICGSVIAEAHTRLIDAVSRHNAVQSFSPHLISRSDERPAAIPFVAGLSSALHDAHLAGGSLPRHLAGADLVEA